MPSLHKLMLSVVPESRWEHVGSVMQEMGSSMGGYVRGTAVDVVIFGVLVHIGYQIIGLDYVLILAIIGGPILAAISAVIIALLQSPTQALMVIALYTILQQIEGNILLPKIMGQQADIPPLLVVFAVIVGAVLGGIFAALVAIPIVGAARVFVLRVILPWLREWTGARDERLSQPAGSESSG